jgi:hypothetical protein
MPKTSPVSPVPHEPAADPKSRVYALKTALDALLEAFDEEDLIGEDILVLAETPELSKGTADLGRALIARTGALMEDASALACVISYFLNAD